jgi:hypothetical protein
VQRGPTLCSERKNQKRALRKGWGTLVIERTEKEKKAWATRPGTKTGKAYVGRHNKPNPAKTRRSNDGRDRTQAKVVRTYPAEDTQAGRKVEQEEIDRRGLENLDNKRNEIAKPK